jgi:hypothetical protein
MEHQLHIYPLKLIQIWFYIFRCWTFGEPKLTNNTPFIKYCFFILPVVLLKMIELEE